jgi:photosystem II stability/assembly factor-like uncharacterized protein
MMGCGTALAQTPDEACAADSLYLISPEMVDLDFEATGNRGLTVSWPNLDLNEATCYSLKNTEGLGFGVTVTGGFGDRVDRVLNFTSQDEGEIGAIQPQNILVNWRNEGPATYGNLGGLFNLSNNGGIWRYVNGSGWTQQNEQLPMNWRQINTVGLAAGSGGYMVAGFSRGVTTGSDPAGLFEFDGSNWSRIAKDTFGTAQLITDVAISPLDNNKFAVGTDRDGLFVTTDGGVTFTQWTTELDPTSTILPASFKVNVVEWVGDRIYVFVNNFGLFISPDNGATFANKTFLVPENLDVDSTEWIYVLPVLEALSFHPSDPNRVAAALQFHGAYESTDGGETWGDLYGDLVVSDPEEGGMWVNSGVDVIYDDAQAQTMVLAVKQKGLYQTTDGGETWVLVADELQPENRAKILNVALSRQAGTPGVIFALVDEHSLLVSSNSGADWVNFFFQPVITKGLFLLSDASGSGDLIMGSWGGGNYIAGTPIALASTYSTATSAELRDMDLGLSMTFTPGTFKTNDSYELVCQTFQGWAVWRGPSQDTAEMTLIGLYDRVNPEDCFEGYCGADDIQPIPNCFRAKRAACFNLDNPDTIRFFDEEVYNGFVYNYSVTSFDYGNTARVTPENNSNEMIFSPRFEGDIREEGGLSPFPGGSNLTSVQINEPVGIGEEGLEEIYVFPNPLRVGEGFPRDPGGTVAFKNIPDGSTILIFTTAGDRVIDIPPGVREEGNILWDTRNSSGEQINSGTYLYKVEIPESDPYWGRLVVIR